MTVQVVTVGGRRVTVVNLDRGDGVPIGVGVRATLAGLGDVADVHDAPDDVPLVLRRGDDDLFRLEPSTATVDPELLADAVDQAVADSIGPRDYRHTQSQPAALWLIEHHLGYLPTFTAYDTEQRPVMHAGITHPVPGEVSEVRFGFPLAGAGYAS